MDRGEADGGISVELGNHYIRAVVLSYDRVVYLPCRHGCKDIQTSRVRATRCTGDHSVDRVATGLGSVFERRA